ncbi:hypothetical protein C370_04553 [Cryptococcus neoformans A1-35-8]|nr:hypothetical protein C370_04553 [Cryptococcus neoformans var. grubii A1-35-8]
MHGTKVLIHLDGSEANLLHPPPPG